ncbi:ATP-dependent carboligase [Sinorhizobium fredii]|uniref:ATP dependent DNA ligase n=1 Tax=Rhizobium fredii TaxID=380 RepID=UPI0004BCF6F0
MNKCKRRASFVILGFEPSIVPGTIGRLLLAARKGEGLGYVGGCGTGWTEDLSRELRQLLEGIATKTPAVDLKGRGPVFTEPLLVAEIAYSAWTEDGKLRHPSLKGIRERADDATIYELNSSAHIQRGHSVHVSRQRGRPTEEASGVTA